MGFLRRLFGGGASTDEGHPPGDEEESGAAVDAYAHLHSVVAWLRLADPTFASEREQQRLFTVEDRAMRALFESGAGDLDTDELDRGFLALRFVGPDADRIVAVVQPLIEPVAGPGSYLAVRRGPAGTAQDRIELGAPTAG